MTESSPCALNAVCTRPLTIGSDLYEFVSLPALQEQLPEADLARLPRSISLLLESVLRHCDGQSIAADAVRRLALWQAQGTRQETPFVVSRVILQDLTGVPLLCDLAAMRDAAVARGAAAERVEPLVPVDMVVDHSVMIDRTGSSQCLEQNMRIEFERNQERYAFMKWGMNAFRTFGIVPPGFGIVHQVNLEYLARGVFCDAGHRLWPDSVVGTDSHTVMINGLGVIGWGVGGIEAEAAMLGQPIYMLTPDVVGVHLTGRLPAGCTTTDLALTITQTLRRHKVVGKFVEFFGPGAAALSVPERATIGNMAPEYGATMGYFPIDEKTVQYLRHTGRTAQEVQRFDAYFKAQHLFGMPMLGEIDYTQTVEIDLSAVRPCVAGPRRPQDRMELGDVRRTVETLLQSPVTENGFGKPAQCLQAVYPTAGQRRLEHGSILIAAITSCTNTSNPSVLLGAGLLAKKAVERGLTVPDYVKTSLAPGSRVVTHYLAQAGLLPYMEKLGFAAVAYGCTTCIGNAGDLAADLLECVRTNDLVTAAVLSGNRNFEARIHPAIKANFLASPALVIAYALAGNVRRDLTCEPLGTDPQGTPVYLRDIWPTQQEIEALLPLAFDPESYRSNYLRIQSDPGELWNAIDGTRSACYGWPASTYIARPPFLENAQAPADILGARALGLFGDSVTTDHISPAGRIGADTPAAQWLREHGVADKDFNSYGSRRGNHEVMMRGTFANVRIKNLMLPVKADGTRTEGGFTLIEPQAQPATIFEAAQWYRSHGTPCLIFGGEEYGTGSSRDWAAKGTQLLGVKAVIVKSFERIHRSNLIGMGVLPLQFLPGDGIDELGLRGDELFDLQGMETLAPQGELTLSVTSPTQGVRKVKLLVRIDTPVELQYIRAGGILPFMLNKLVESA